MSSQNDERVFDRLGLIDTRLERYNTLLEVHIKRTDLLEEKLVPIEKHVAIVGAIGKWLFLSGGLVGLIGALVALLKLLP